MGAICNDYADQKVTLEVSLSNLLEDPNAERLTRLMREDISDSNIEVIYRQLAGFLLKLFNLSFDRISCLPSPKAEAQNPTLTRQLTLRIASS